MGKKEKQRYFLFLGSGIGLTVFYSAFIFFAGRILSSHLPTLFCSLTLSQSIKTGTLTGFGVALLTWILLDVSAKKR